MRAPTQRTTALLERPDDRDARELFHRSMQTVKPTAKQLTHFNFLYADGCRYHVEETERGFEIWDVKTDKIITTKSSRIQADAFVDAMESEDDQ